MIGKWRVLHNPGRGEFQVLPLLWSKDIFVCFGAIPGGAQYYSWLYAHGSVLADLEDHAWC